MHVSNKAGSRPEADECKADNLSPQLCERNKENTLIFVHCDGTMEQPGSTSENVSINFKKLKGHNIAKQATGVGKVLLIK